MNFIRPKSLISIFTIGFLLSLTTKAKGAGTRGSGGGGDPINIQLDISTQQIVETLRVLRTASDAYTEEERTKFKEHVKDLCSKQYLDDSVQIETCGQFLIAAAQQIPTCSKSIPLVVEDPSDEESKKKYKFPYEYGDQPVTAFTEFGCDKPIYFNYNRIRSTEPEFIFTTIMHEFGHKVLYRSGRNMEPVTISDDHEIGGFSNGATLLNKASRALYAYFVEIYGQNKLPIPTVDRKNLSMIRDYFLCEVNGFSDVHGTVDKNATLENSDRHKFRFFTTRLYPTPDYYISENIMSNPIGIVVTDLFPPSARTLNRDIYLSAKFTDDGDCYARTDQDSTNIQLISYPHLGQPGLSSQQRKADLLDSDSETPEHVNRLCPNDNPSPTFALRYLETVIKCRYEGLFRY